MVTDHRKMSASSRRLAAWNDEMVIKYHSHGTLFESRNLLLRWVEKSRLKTIIRMAKITSRDSVLDLGCGEGHMLSMIKSARKLTGIDISEVALRRARRVLDKKGVRAELFFGDAQDLKLAERYDKILCSEMLEHVPDPALVMENIFAALKDDGTLVVSIPDEKRIKSIVFLMRKTGILRLLHAARKGESYDWHLHEASIPFLRKIASRRFKIIKIRKVPFILEHRIVASLKKIS